MQAVAVLAACLIALALVFQVALAAGARSGAAAYGGRFVRDDGTLPTRYRGSSAAAAVVLAGAAWLVLAAGSVISPGPVPPGVLTVGTWVLACFFALNTLGNLASIRSSATAPEAPPPSSPCCASSSPWPGDRSRRHLESPGVVRDAPTAGDVLPAAVGRPTGCSTPA